MNNKIRYKNQKQSNTKNIVIIIIINLAILLAILITTINFITSTNTKKNERQNAINNKNFNSIQDVLEYYKCTYIKDNVSTEENYEIDIYAKICCDLYDGDKSNEKFYNNLINDIAKFITYKNFRLIDETKEEKIEICVICDGKEIDTIYINGIEDYFIYMDSMLDMKNYTEIPISEISIQAPEIINCIQNNWNSNTEFGSRESIFQKYYIYFEEGIKTRRIDGKIYNIVFTDKYKNPVVNGFYVGMENNDVIRRLGEPAFKNEDGSIVGYKSKDIYVFFEKNQISIYRNTKEEGFDDFFELVDKFLAEEYSLLEFMNELTYLWPDYEEYTYGSDTVFLSYPNKGIDIKINYENVDGIVLYNNIDIDLTKINKYIQNTEFVSQLRVDNVFNAEKRRFSNEKSILNKCKEYKEKYEENDNHNRGKVYDYYMNMTDEDEIKNVYFISIDSQYPNYELNEAIDYYIWINDYIFVYSITGNGIYFYNLQNNVKGIIEQEEEKEFEIKSYENGVLTYDDKTISIQ